MNEKIKNEKVDANIKASKSSESTSYVEAVHKIKSVYDLETASAKHGMLDKFSYLMQMVKKRGEGVIEVWIKKANTKTNKELLKEVCTNVKDLTIPYIIFILIFIEVRIWKNINI